MKTSSSSPFNAQINKRDRFGFFNSSALSPALFLSLFLATLLALFLLYSPNPLINANNLKHHHRITNPPQKDDRDRGCNISRGRWVHDRRGPSYTNTSCTTIPDSKNCFRHGRKDRGFLNWRWKPDGCELPRFDARAFLEMVRGKTMAFIGDSVARNHMESLLCLLSQEEIPTDVYKDSEDRFRTWRFSDHDFVLKILWSQFLVKGVETVINGSASGNFELHLDRVDEKWAQELSNIDYAIISAAHWFFRKIYVYDGSNLLGCVYCNDANVTLFGPEHALRLAMRATFDHINRCRSCRNLVTLLRTFSPAHFEDGTWNTGGRCSRTRPYGITEISLESSGSSEWNFRNMQVKEVVRARKIGAEEGQKFGVVDVTRAMLMRPDGHPGEFWDNKWMKGCNDCVHWCMPGPIDAWNDFLMASLRRLEI